MVAAQFFIFIYFLYFCCDHLMVGRWGRQKHTHTRHVWTGFQRKRRDRDESLAASPVAADATESTLR